MTDPRRRDLLRMGVLLLGGPPAAGAGRAAEAAAGAPQLSLLSPTAQEAPFCAGFALRMGDFPAGSGLVVSNAVAQASVKNRWPDGSAKFAIIAGTAKLSARVPTTVSVAPGTPDVGRALDTHDLQGAMTQALTLDCGGLGSAGWSGGDWARPFETWIAGHRMSSWLYRKPVGDDAHLVAWLEVRLFADGSVEVLPWIENGYLLVPGPTSKRATFTLALGGSQRFSAPIDLPHHCRTPLLSGTALSHWLGTDPSVTVLHDRDYLQATGLVPAYAARTPAAAPCVADLPSSFAPLQLGSWPSGMGSGGYDKSIGLLPEWDVVHLTCGNAATYEGVIRNAYSAGRFPFHYRDEKTQRAPRLSQHASLNIKDPAPGWVTTPAAGGTTPGLWSLSHQPSAGYLAFLLTGRRYHLDTVQLAASSNALYESSTARGGAKGIFKTSHAGAARHTAWCLRTLATAIAATPDSDAALLGEYRAQFANNMGYYHALYVAQPHNPFGFVMPPADYNGEMGGTVAEGATTSVIPCNPGALYGAPYNRTADDQYVRWKLLIGNETRTVTAYAMASETLTISPPLPAAPSAGTRFWINDGVWFDAPWMGNFLIAALGFARDLALGLDTASAARFEAFYAWKARAVIGMLGGVGPDDYLYRDYGAYTIAIAPFDPAPGPVDEDPRWLRGRGPWFRNWGEVWAATYAGKTLDDSNHKPPPYAPHGPKVEGDLRANVWPEGAGAIAVAAIAYAVRHDLPGASDAYRRLTSAANWSDLIAAMDRQPVWSVSPGRGRPSGNR